MFVGRKLKRLDNAVTFEGLQDYYQTIIDSLGLTKAKPATTTGPKHTTATCQDTALETVQHRLLRSIVGKLL